METNKKVQGSNSLLVCLILVIATLTVYGPVRNYGFINYDDPWYVTDNKYVKHGLSATGFVWAFSFKDKENSHWHPLTWLSHMLDCQLYGLNPGAHHSTNLLFHMASSVLLFLSFHRMTGALWPSALTAALFALHPINVDSVVWIAERKNVLSTFFWMLALLTYARYCERPSASRYAQIVIVFVCGLLAKPMVVTLPFVLLLLDFWPLKRLSHSKTDPKTTLFFHSRPVALVIEKIPLFILMSLSIYISSMAFAGTGNMWTMEAVPLKLRIANALVSYWAYIGKMVWPANLTIHYPYPTIVPLWQSVSALLLLIFISILIIKGVRRYPFLFVGWFWYLGTLVPALGLVQVGLWPAMADRFAYVPLIGLFLMVTWTISALISALRPNAAWPAVLATILLLSAPIIVTRLQLRYWTNSETLFRHALSVNGNNFMAHAKLGEALVEQGKLTEAITHYYKVLEIFPQSKISLNNLGNALVQKDRYEEAIKLYKKVLSIDPHFKEVQFNLGNTLAIQGKLDAAIVCFAAALRIDSSYQKAREGLEKAIKIIQNDHN
jgi:cytochrome c-type biogenesis protein CcmH/NrfG